MLTLIIFMGGHSPFGFSINRWRGNTNRNSLTKQRHLWHTRWTLSKKKMSFSIEPTIYIADLITVLTFAKGSHKN